MNKSPTTLSAPDIVHEISQIQVQLRELDEEDDEFEVKKMVLDNGLASLENQLAAMRRTEDVQAEDETEYQVGDLSSLPSWTDNSRPQSSSALLDPAQGFASYAGSYHDNFAGQSPPDGVIAGHSRVTRAPAWNFGTVDGVSSTPNTPNSLDGRPSSASVSSPDSGFLVPQKRHRGSGDGSNRSNDSADHASKSMRATPSPAITPAITGTSTPTSDDSLDIPADLVHLFGGDPNGDNRKWKEEAKAEEAYYAELQRKREQERLDEEYARSLEVGDISSPSTAVPSAGPSSAPSRYTSQAILDAQGRYRRPSPPPTDNNQYFHSELPFKQENVSYASSHTPVKQGKSQSSFHFDPNDYINLDSDDDFSNLDEIPGHLSSDPIEIDPHTWRKTTQQDPFRSSQYSMPGSMNHNPTGSSSSAGLLGQSLVNSAKGAYNSAYNFLDQQIGDYGSPAMGFGGASIYGIGGSSSSHVPIIDLEADDQTPQELAYSALDRCGINANDPANRDLLESYIDRYNYVTHDPKRTAAEIKSLLENIRPDEDLPPEDREGTPEAMTYTLMEHQKLGLAWMRKMEENDKTRGGILADDMGLGKTIQALALLVSRRSFDPNCKTTLIVAPVALMKQWQREIETKLKPGRHSLSTFILHGTSRETSWAKLRTFDVVLTTFGTLATELKRKEGIFMKKRVNPNWRPTAKAHRLPLLGDECKWYRVIIDEAQCIKNKSTKQALAAAALNAKTRFCMTGTPMMNNVGELYSLIHFLRIQPYCEPENFSRTFTRPLKGSSDGLKDKAMKKLQVLLRGILLRRTKKSQIDGKPILNLPERTTEIQHAPFNDEQSDFYKALENRTRLQFNKYLKSGTVGRNYSNILVLLLRLRQACCHPHLIKDFGEASGNADVTAEEMIKLAKELAPDVVARVQEQCKSNEDAVLECPVCMDMTENATIFIPCGHNTCSECFARITDPAQAIANGYGEGGGESKCPNCRGKITPSKVIDSVTFKKVHMAELAGVDDVEDEEDSQADVETTDESGSEDGEDEDGDEVDSKGNIKDFVVDDGVVEDDESETDEGESGAYRPGKNPFDKSSLKKTKKSKGKGKAKADKPAKKTLAQLKKEASGNAKARRRYLKRLSKEWESSSKIDITMEILRGVQNGKDQQTQQSEKTIIFSQFTSLLDLLEVPIAKEGWGYRRYDGSMNANARNHAVLEFTDKRDCKIMLVSLKAGNAGLNLVAASQVIIFDPFWNPYIEEQAIDRAHRIGQLKPVRVHRVLVPDTVEDRILALQEKKRALIEGALDENASKNVSRLDERALAFLFDVPY